ncbi:MAG: fumarylacetoacetate hydrolase family protein [Alphaproteobacteria bacterium]|nr:fumarylacetoacetate hydrolase family protein [Alphaproteobacteria bacterium]
MTWSLSAADCLPNDGVSGTLIGRAWIGPDGNNPAGPAVIALRPDGVFDITATVPTVSMLCNAEDPVTLVRGAQHARRLGTVDEIIANSSADARDPRRPWLLAPVDLQAVKAAGVTFALSMLERVIEEHAKGDPRGADAARAKLTAEIGADLRQIKPGSQAAQRLKQVLIQRGLWSQYLEVGIGPYAEIFTKCPPMASVGLGAEIGVHRESTWNNPEPEIVMVVDARGRAVGATLGNDVNLRDFEGRSALLLGKAKDNNASSAIGPFIRLFDASFSLDDVRQAELRLHIAGIDGFTLDGHSSMKLISRDVLDLIAHAGGAHHQYPDGFALFTGTMFAPTKDRDAAGLGFTHKLGDIVAIRTPKLGALVNRVTHADRAPPWTFGTGALMQNLRARGVLYPRFLTGACDDGVEI